MDSEYHIKCIHRKISNSNGKFAIIPVHENLEGKMKKEKVIPIFCYAIFVNKESGKSFDVNVENILKNIEIMMRVEMG